MDVIIGVDGGGTKTNLVALDAATGAKLGSASAGSINVYFGGLAQAAGNLREGLEALSLGPEDRILGVGIGDPALDDSCLSEGAQLRERISGMLPGNPPCFSRSDVFMALYGFTGGQAGALLVAGTGSMGVGMAAPYCHGQENPMVTVGGWGNPTTDPGSGNDIGTRGICAALDAFDGVGRQTALCGAAMKFYGAAEPRQLVAILNGEDMTRSRIAAFSRQVASCADDGDPVSISILEKAGQALGGYGCSLLRQVGGDAPLGAYGSVLVNNGTVRRIFTETVQKEFPQAAVSIPQVPPEYGAARFAANALGIYWEERK